MCPMMRLTGAFRKVLTMKKVNDRLKGDLKEIVSLKTQSRLFRVLGLCIEDLLPEANRKMYFYVCVYVCVYVYLCTCIYDDSVRFGDREVAQTLLLRV